MSAYPENSLDVAVAEFFSETSATREACDTKAKDLVGGEVVPVTVQATAATRSMLDLNANSLSSSGSSL